MNFIKACAKLKEGKLVRRKTWKVRFVEVSERDPNCSYGTIKKRLPLTEHVGHDGSFYYRTNLSHEGGHVTCNYDLNMDDVLATDWVVVIDKGRKK